MLAALEKKQQFQKDKQDTKPVILSGRLWVISFFGEVSFWLTYTDLKICNKRKKNT